MEAQYQLWQTLNTQYELSGVSDRGGAAPPGFFFNPAENCCPLAQLQKKLLPLHS
jgi:hypothetical protein